MSSNAPPVALLSELGLLDAGGNSTRRAVATVTLPSSTLELYYDMAFTALSGLSYLAVVVCTVAMFLHLRRSFTAAQKSGAVPAGEDGQSRRSQARQINAILLVQALIPLVFDYIPAYSITAAITVSKSDSLAQTLAFITAWMVWAPVVNAAAILLVVGPYRQAVFRRSADKVVLAKATRVMSLTKTLNSN